MCRKQIIDIDALLGSNQDLVTAIRNGEAWALAHIKRCESINAREPEGFRRPFDGKPRKWCGGACTSPEGCVMCTLPDDPLVARANREYRATPDPQALASQGIITIDGEIDDAMVAAVRNLLTLSEDSGVEELEFRITSDGGEVPAGLRICDMIQAAKVRRRVGFVKYYARSMALIILQACDYRVATPKAQLLLHHTWRKVTIETLSDPMQVQRMVDSSKPSEERMDAMLTSRTGRTLREIKNVCAKDADMTSQQALRFGLIDAIRAQA